MPRALGHESSREIPWCTEVDLFQDIRRFVLDAGSETTSGYLLRTPPVLKSFPRDQIKAGMHNAEIRSGQSFWGIVPYRLALDGNVMGIL